ncbi:hypothetical protein O6H91_Y415200 [Diphasiastrum complanatum]|nr:hypothetical protein O6H91_Y415200 [Diphasiastrum complanatum]
MEFKEGRIDEQKLVHGSHFPLLLFPAAAAADDASSSSADAFALAQAILRNREWIERCLRRSGAILLRGFGVRDAWDFNEVVESFGYSEQPYAPGVSVRKKIVGRVCTVDDWPAHLALGFHNEMAYRADYPDLIMFYCDVEPTEGGCTPIVSGKVVYQRMKEHCPDFVEKLRERGLRTERLMEEHGPRGWRTILQTDDVIEAMKRLNDGGRFVKCLDDRSLVSYLLKPSPGVAKYGGSGDDVWFNSIGVALIWRDTHKTSFGDGSAMPEETLDHCLQILQEEQVAIPWKKGDILVLDNMLVQHAREPFLPPRNILVSLCRR